MWNTFKIIYVKYIVNYLRKTHQIPPSADELYDIFEASGCACSRSLSLVGQELKELEIAHVSVEAVANSCSDAYRFLRHHNASAALSPTLRQRISPCSLAASKGVAEPADH